ncbi:putative AbiEi antitoxin of type IV toxin-antitoxin system [Haloactinopolyspora alba]|uniref:Putative AbiEi antitoxin of type IV toxin-antitoxin system n=1 Tax=Haloactinopolyspora alba TaxID=648780 RepID=A0A2P8EBS1_9ACTN|nr:type IV toxin-antitoxin system AbiEi family antitoxin domain-containing protein [Haloactinopolyspora alba]PSL06931.1 putative AbiEi antitoxin of type IV toxin-antitoxin system [Haloactinopolyspora alba]
MPARPRTLPSDVTELLARHRGVLTTSVALAAGIHEGRLRRLRDAGLLTRVAPRCYVSTVNLGAASPWERHRLHAAAFVLSRDQPVFLTGWSAVVTFDLPTVGSPPRLPQALRSAAFRASTQATQFGIIRAVCIPAGQARRLGDVSVMSRQWAVADVARSSPIPDALVVADAAAQSGADLHEAVRHMAGWPGVHRARWVAEHADALAESPLETLGRFTCIQFDLPMPVSNAWVGADRPEFRVDGLWPYHWVASEADGAIKYDNRSDASRIVARQTEREWRLRRLGLDIGRYDWDLASRDRPELARRFAALLRDNPARQQPVRWWKHHPDAGPIEPQPHDWPSPWPVSFVLPAGWNT